MQILGVLQKFQSEISQAADIVISYIPNHKGTFRSLHVTLKKYIKKLTYSLTSVQKKIEVLTNNRKFGTS